MFKLLMENSSDPECGMLQQLPDASIFTAIHLSNALGLTPFICTKMNICLKDLGMKHQLNLHRPICNGIRKVEK